MSKTVTIDENADKTKYILDITGSLPVVLAEIDKDTGNMVRSYIYAGSQPVGFYDGDWRSDGTRYYYMHDRLGSVRAVAEVAGAP